MVTFDQYPLTPSQVEHRVKELLSDPKNLKLDRATQIKLLSYVDLTSLEGSDTTDRIVSVCDKAKNLQHLADDVPGVAAVCFYPPFIRRAKKELEGSGIRVASVAGAFPSGQAPLSAKLEEVRYAVEEGADEIDTVISRGKLLEGAGTFVSDEIAAIKDACGKIHLKVILETGELKTPATIRLASELAINAGADFIKTSTGKVQPAATLEAFLVMSETVREYFNKTGKKIGIKPAGGITSPDQALQYLNVLRSVLGDPWMSNEHFRIGASRLTDGLTAGIVA